MQRLNTLNMLLEMTKEAERLASEGVQTERINTLIGSIRRKAHEEQEKLGRDQRQSESFIPTRYQPCMIGIREECNFGRSSIPSVSALGGRLGRIREEIDRTIKEMKVSSRIM